jgi:branched-chain amino acid transport system ATP-binding protein
MNPPLLEVQGLDVAYGPVQVLFGVDLTVEQGEIVALLGTNGAGKSTLLKAISGLMKPGRGSVAFEGDDITGIRPEKAAARGLLQMPGGKGIFPTLSVAENLRLGAWLFRKDKERLEAAQEQARQLFPVLERRWGALAGDLSGGEQQMLTLAQAFMNEPRLLMIDELSLGLAPAVVGELIEVVQRLHEHGTTMIVVEQSVNVALTLAKRAVFMEKGQVRFSGATEDLLDRPDVLRSVFIAGAASGGGAAPAAVPKRAAPPADAPVVLECSGVVKRFGGVRAVDGVDLELREGQILGLIGQNGAGKTTLFDCISGFLDVDEGSVRLKGYDITGWQPHERAAATLGRSFQEARLYPSLTAAETIAVSLERHLASKDLVAAAMWLPATYESELAVADRVDELIELMGLGAFREKLVGELSTGSRRIVELACILAQDPSVLLLDEPSGGVAQKETEALGPLLQRVQAHTGCAILVIEHDMPLLKGLCDRMVALELGRVIAQGTPDEVLDDPKVIESYLGTDEAAINRSGARGAPAEGNGTKPRTRPPAAKPGDPRPRRRSPLRADS